MSRKVNDGDETGYKQDKLKNSRFDRDNRNIQLENYNRGYRSHGGALIGHDQASQGNRGRGPRGYKRSDKSIYEDVCDMLFRSSDVDATEIEVSVKEGIVFLNGSVTDRETKKMAELEIENISGVFDVLNFLKINSAKRDFH
jgi:hypothetical protein